ncbi:MAG TPA: response regulator transcription factor [Bacteroidia bacterium]|jgi:DNA-binding NarL/FixJ family response regulator|nr:response regulator transcription factor [Bacteroidia bacterium]
MKDITQIVIYEDNPDLLQTLSELILSIDEFNLLGAFPNAENVLNDMERLTPEIVLMDIEMPGTNGKDALKKIKSKYPETEIIMLTVFEDNANIFESIKSGASGYILKRTPPDKIVESIKDVKKGGVSMTPSVAKKILQLLPKSYSETSKHVDLSPREIQILTLLTRGFSYKMISSELTISIDTVRTFIKRIYKKLHVNSMTEAVSKAINDRLV